MTYAEFAERLRATRILSDPWIEGEERFREAPIVISSGDRDGLYAAAEDMARLTNEVCRLVMDDPALLDEHVRLTPCQKLMWLASAGAWHGIARADVFRTDDGWKICELNCDTPSGQAEAVVLGRVARDASPRALDPNEALLDRITRMVSALARRANDAGGAPTVGIVYPTEMTEDLSMVEIYRQAFTRAGLAVVLGSPYNLELGASGRAALFGRACDVVLRHYKTDWWGEREAVWDDADPLRDPAPLTGPLAVALEAQATGRTAFVNPFGAVVPQNKRVMALMWEHKARLPAWAQDAVVRLVPETRRLESVETDVLVREQGAWVLKSDYGCEGAEVLLGDGCTPEEWRRALEHAVPGRWIAQRRFSPRIETARGESINYGIYVVAGEACGVLARVQSGATDRFARAAAVLVEPAS